MAKVVLKNVRLSFPAIWKPEQYMGQGEPRYKASFLFEPTSDSAKAVNAAIMEAAKEAYGDKAKMVLDAIKGSPKEFPLSKGDLKDYEGYAGMLVLSSANKMRPDIRDRDKTPLTQQDGRPYAGCYVNAVVDIWAQVKNGKAIRCKLLGIQFVRDGDAFSGGERAKDDDFEDLGDGADAPDLGSADDISDLV